MDSIGKQSVTGVVWSSVERFSIKGLQFLLQIIMARLLLPSDYGIVGQSRQNFFETTLKVNKETTVADQIFNILCQELAELQ